MSTYNDKFEMRRTPGDDALDPCSPVREAEEGGESRINPDNLGDDKNAFKVPGYVSDTSLSIKDWCEEINKWAVRKGWNRDLYYSLDSLAKQQMNFHSEISEAWEELREGHSVSEVYYNWDLCDCGCPIDHVATLMLHSPGCRALKPEGFPIEMADLVIRVMHTMGFYGIDLEEMIKLKMGYNEMRDFRHGGKLA